MAEPPGQHRLREVFGEARDSAWCVSHGGVTGGADRGLLQSVVASLGLPTGDVSLDRASLLLHHLRLCGH